jgi:hypothetical protein
MIRIPAALLFAFVIVSSTVFGNDTNISGFIQALYGGGTDRSNPTSSELTASEIRWQLRMESFSDAAEFFGRLDFVYDDFYQPEYNWELREAYIKFRIGNRLDVKIGRQIITWGTGDLIFINDVFAKDYQAFFIGRDDQYLKAPHNAAQMELYTGLGVFTAVYTPRFTPNRLPEGRRLSYFNPFVGRIVGGEDFLFSSRLPSAKFNNGELATRFSRYIGSADVALYFYRGFYENPVGMDMTDTVAYFPRLHLYGASLRFPLLGGIAWLETGYFQSRNDIDGNDPTIPNSAVKALVGFERQLSPTLTVNMQYQNETMLDYDRYVSGLQPGMIQADESYHLITSRIMKLLRMETIKVSAFVFYSPSEEDVYGRFSIDYKHTDALTLTVGANVFHGKHDYTDFGAFQKNDNVYAKVTYGY